MSIDITKEANISLAPWQKRMLIFAHIAHVIEKKRMNLPHLNAFSSALTKAVLEIISTQQGGMVGDFH